MADQYDLDGLVSELKAVVEQRRAAGDYPADLADQLDSNFARARSLQRFDFDPLRRTMDHLDAASHFTLDRIGHESNLPGGSAVHRAAGAAVRRPVQGVLDQTQQFADAVREVLRQVADALDDPRSHDHTDLRGDIDMLLLRVTELEREVRRGRAPAGVGLDDSAEVDIDWEAFSHRFRGDEAALAETYVELLERLNHHEPVLDIGCGSGFFLHALGARGVQARGVDTDPALVEVATQRGLDVAQQDALTALSTATESSLGAVVLLQVVEHVPAAELPRLVRAARRALRADGILVMETPNADSLFVHSHSFWLDPTHVRLVPAAYLAFLLERSGFRSVEVQHRSAVPDDQALVELPDDVPGADAMNENIRRLNATIYGPQDVLVVGVA